MRIGRPYFSQNQFYEENKHAFVKSNIFSMLVKFTNSFEHLIKTLQRKHYSKAITRAKVALQEVSFDWLIV